MRRHVRHSQHSNNDDFDSTSNVFFQPASSSEVDADLLQLDFLPRSSTKPHRFENTIEAKIEAGETLQALALRFHCSVADIKRLNKIDKDNEIYARKVVKIPVTVHSLLSNTLPEIHKSGNNSPRHTNDVILGTETNLRNPLDESAAVLSEKLMVASVNASEAASNSINQVILNSKLAPSSTYAADTILTNTANVDHHEDNSPLLSGILDEETLAQPRPIRGPSMRAIDWSGSDCDMSWVCLFVFILALCFVIPLIYVIYLAEHPHHHHNNTMH